MHRTGLPYARRAPRGSRSPLRDAPDAADAAALRRTAQTRADQGDARPVRYRSGGGQTLPIGSSLQSLQTHSLEIGRRRRRDRDRQIERRARRPDGNGQDAHGTHDRTAAERPLHHRRRHGAHRSRLRGRRRGEHPLAAVAGGLLRRGASSSSTRSTRSPARATTRRSHATYRAKGCSRRC